MPARLRVLVCGSSSPGVAGRQAQSRHLALGHDDGLVVGGDARIRQGGHVGGARHDVAHALATVKRLALREQAQIQLLARVGLIDHRFLIRHIRYAIVGVAIAVALMPPPVSTIRP